MTNTQNTPVEALEGVYPLRVVEYAIRRGSGGDGLQDGGDGLKRSIRLETDGTVSLVTERRHHPPQGRAGGENGATGRNVIDGETVPTKTTRAVDADTVITVLTPGGGGYGPRERDGTDRAGSGDGTRE